MVAILFTLFAATVSTIIVVIMANIFLCCWRKKGLGNIAPDKSSDVTEELKERPASLVKNHGAPQNGVVLETPKPLVVVVPNSEDLGDFSAVQRETEILRSYRKPPPPKNRAGPSRAARTLKSDTESLDLFNELNENDVKTEPITDKEMRYFRDVKTEPITDKEMRYFRDNMDSTQMHGQTVGENIAGCTRSSMLADIDQMLATLHYSQDSSAQLSLSEDKINDGKSSSKNITEQNFQTNLASEMGADQIVIIPEINLESAATLSVSPKSSPTSRRKHGPKVSPKPSPRTSLHLTSKDVEAGAAQEQLSVNSSTLEVNTGVTDSNRTDVAGSSTQPDPPIKTDMNQVLEESTSSSQPTKSLDNTKTETDQSQRTLNISESYSAHLRLLLQDFHQSEDANMNNCEAVENSDTPEIQKHDIMNTNEHEDQTTEANIAVNVSIPEAPPPAENKILVSSNGEKPIALVNGKGSETSQYNNILLPKAVSFEPSSQKKESAALATGSSEPACGREVFSAADGSGQIVTETGKVLKELPEDQNMKGKISRIPVRAGSKPRTSPPPKQASPSKQT